MRLWIGTSGYAYKEWKGPFYPERLPDREMLAFYGTRLNAVEVNNTFYRMPTAEGLLAWRAQVPEHFRFVLKASQRITHQRRLRNATEEVAYLVRTASELGPTLGPVLFQLPPNLKQDQPLLLDFLAQLPEGFQAAFEFRHPSWLDDGIFEALGSRGAALVASDTGEDGPEAILSRTAPFGYARLRREGYEPADLASWAERLLAPGWADLHVFFKHEDAGTGPRLAAAFREVVGTLGGDEGQGSR